MESHSLDFVPMKQSDLETLQEWFEDEELRQRMGGCLPLQTVFDYVQSEPDYFAWMVMESEEPIGAAFLQIEPGEPQGFGFFVKPELRHRGYGQRIVEMLLARPEAASAPKWQVSIWPNNIASQRCLMSAGFALESDTPDAQGFLQYVYDRQETGKSG